MRATDIIRSVLDLLDRVEDDEPDMVVQYTDQPDQEYTKPSRFRQIFDMLQSKSTGEYANTPNEVVAGIDSVTTNAGGGINGPKHPADIRVKDPSGY